MRRLVNRAVRFVGAHLPILGVFAILLLAVLLLWHGNANSTQAQPAMMAQVRFQGQYQIAGGSWQEIVEGVHIPANRGDVVLRGNFHMLTPYGEYVGIYSGETPIALYTDHIHVSLYLDGAEYFSFDMENPLYGASACGASWTACVVPTDAPIELRIHNPHQYGNINAIEHY